MIQHVSAWKEDIKLANSQNVIFVGVHCRRLDYKDHLKVWTNADLVDHHFFDTAFDIYRKRYNNEQTKVIFLAVSDDVPWIKVFSRESNSRIANVRPLVR